MNFQGNCIRLPSRGLCLLGLVCLFLQACIPQIFSSSNQRLVSLTREDLETHGIAFITPSTVTGQEEEKQAVAGIFAEVLIKERPKLRCLTLPETLNAINQASFTNAYRTMYADYRDTGLFKRDVLQRIGEATKTRYVVQLKLSGFGQGSSGRLNLFGLRLIETKQANIRLFCQIWDTWEGTIGWEGYEEMNYGVDTFTERNVSLKKILEIAAKNLVSRIP